MRRASRLAIRAALVVFLVIAVVVAIAHLPPARRYVLSQVSRLLAGQNIDLRAQRLDYNLLALSAGLDRVEVRAAGAADLPPVLTLESARVNLSLLSLLRGRYVVEDARITGAALHVVVAEDGSDNVPRLPPSPEPDTPSEALDYLISHFVLDGGRIRYEDRRQALDVSLPIASVEIRGNAATRAHRIALAAGPGALGWHKETASIDRLAGQLTLGPDSLDVTTLELDAAGSKVAVRGRVEHLSDPRLDLNANLDANLDTLTGFAALPSRVGGRLSATVSAAGTVPALRVGASLRSQDLAFRELTGVGLNVRAEYDAAADRARLVELGVTSPAGHVSARADVALTPAAGGSTLDASFDGLRLDTLSRVAESPYVAAGRLDGQVGVRWPALDYLQATGRADLRLVPTVARASKNVIPLSGRLVANAEGRTAVLDVEQVRALGAAFDGRVSLRDRRELGGRLRAEAADLGRLVAGVEAFLGRQPGTLVGTRLGGPLYLQADLGGTIEKPAVAATLESPALDVATLDDAAVAVSARYDPAKVTLDKLRVTWREQQIAASGRVDLEGARRIDLTAGGDGLRIETILEGLGRSDIRASGTLSLASRVTGTLDAPRATVAIDGTQLTAYDEQLGTLAARARFADRLVTLDELRLKQTRPDGTAQLAAKGSYELDSKRFSLDLGSDGLRLTDLTLDDGTAVRGAIDVSASGRGTIEAFVASLRLGLDDVRIGDEALGSVTVSADVADRVASIHAAVDRFHLTANAKVGMESPYPGQVEITADATDLGELPLGLEDRLAGHVTARVEGGGNLSTLQEASGVVIIDPLAASWQGQPIESDGPIVVRYADRRVAVERLGLRAKSSSVTASGDLPLDEKAAPGTLKVGARLDLESLVSYAPPDSKLSATGVAELTGEIRGSATRFDPSFTLDLRDATLSQPSLDPPVSNLTVRATVGDGELRLERASANWGEARIEATARLPFGLLPPDLPVQLPRTDGPADLKLDLASLDLGRVAALPDEVGGRLAISLTARADRLALDAVNASLTFPELRVSYDDVSLEQQGVSTIRLADGRATIERFALDGPLAHIVATGTAGLDDSQPLDLTLDAKLDAGLAAALTDGVRAEGPIVVTMAATGTRARPSVDGFFELSDARVSLDEPRLAVEALNVRLDLAGPKATLTRLTGQVNGGTLGGGGTLELGDGGLSLADLRVQLDDVFFDEPMKLQTVSDAELTLTGRGGDLELGGTLTVIEGGLTQDIDLDTGLLANFGGPTTIDLTEERSPSLERLGFNLAIRTASPILIENNLARAAVTADLRLLGNVYDTGLTGRLTLEEGSELILNERTYQVERGVVTFTDDNRIAPSLDVAARTSVGRFDVSLGVSGEPGNTEVLLTADPTLPEPDIISLLATGRTLDETRGQELDVAKSQVLSLLAGRAGAGIGQALERATGLSSVRVEPNLIAGEADPSARLTVAQNLTNDLRLIYSTDLVNSSDQIWVAEYDVTRQFVSRLVRQSDDSYRFDFRHDVRFGGRPEPRRVARVAKFTIGQVTIDGAEASVRSRIEDRLKLAPGDKYDFFETRRRTDAVRALFEREDRLEARVQLGRTPRGDVMDLALTVQPGPRVSLQYDGLSPPGEVRSDARDIWQRGVFDAQRAGDVIDALRRWLVDERHLDARIEYEVSTPGPDLKQVVFRIEPGPRFTDIALAFECASGIPPETLAALVESQELGRRAFIDADPVTDLLRRYYREQGYLTAEVSKPRYELDAARLHARAVIPIVEGPRYRVREISVQGNRTVPSSDLLAELPLERGGPYLPAVAERTSTAIRERYWRRGYNDMRLETTLTIDRDLGVADVVFAVAEGPRAVVAEIGVDGHVRTSEQLVRSQLVIAPGDAVNVAKIGESRRNLYRTGAYSLVDIARVDLSVPSPPPASEGSGREAQAAPAQDIKSVKLAVLVREVEPYQMRYGAFFDTERGPGGILDVSNHNSLGHARVIGLRTRYDSQVREARLYLSQPSLRQSPLESIGALYYRQERNPETSQTNAFNVNRAGVSIQQERQLGNSYVWNYGYRFERSRTWDPSPGGFLDVTVHVSPLTSTISRETRDDVVDASRGSFQSHALSFSPEFLGSDVRFLKYFGQYFRYFPLQAPKRKPFTTEILRPRLVYAAGARLGLARGFAGQALPQPERFFGGGSTTIRGFEQNTLGAIGPDGIPLGGEGMFVLNNELRAPLAGMFDGVVFLDVGGIFNRVEDVSLSGLREAAGLGLRVRTPWFLVRVDYGVPLDRRAGESRGQLFFSIGQAF